MEENTTGTTTSTERRGLALAALIMSLVALLCAFIVGWRMFSVAVAGAAFIVSVFVLTKVRHAGPSKRMSVAALCISLVAAALSCYYLSALQREENNAVIPAELRDSSATAPDESTLDRLRNSMDSAQTGG